MAMLGQTSLIEMFFDKQTGEILEIIVDGEIKAPAIEEGVNSKKIPIFGLLRQQTVSDMGGLSLELKKYKDL